MVDLIKEIIENAYSDYRITRVLNTFNIPSVVGKAFEYNENAPPAFTIGYYFILPFGWIYISDRLLEQLIEKELEWTILHELAHIYNRHLGWSILADYVSMFSAEYLAEILGTPLSFGEFIIKSIRAYVTATSGGITRAFELEADEYATAYQGTNTFGISVLNKLSGGDLDRVSHVSTGYCFAVPALTIRQRIDVLKNLNYLN